MATRTHLSFLLLSVVVASLTVPSAGVFHIVGAGKGWAIAPNQTYYADWARTREIHVGDKLMFLYRSGVYDIVEVPTKALFDACSMNNVTMRYQLGPTIIKLTEPGPRYYFCGVGKHCEGGQKVAVNVLPGVAAPVGLPLPPPPAPLAQPAKKKADHNVSHWMCLQILHRMFVACRIWMRPHPRKRRTMLWACWN